jgi:hypothetical protein
VNAAREAGAPDDYINFLMQFSTSRIDEID